VYGIWQIEWSGIPAHLIRNEVPQQDSWLPPSSSVRSTTITTMVNARISGSLGFYGAIL